MEWKIGEIFEHNGDWYQCVESDNCDRCSLSTTECGSGIKSDLAVEVFGNCSKLRRLDNKHAIFKKLEKFGDPYEYYVSKKGIIQVQDYLLADPIHTIYNKIEGVYDYLDNKVVIEIKQTNEIMEEKKLNLKTLRHSEGKRR